MKMAILSGRTRAPCSLVLVAALAAAAAGQSLPWKHPDGTTHWFEVVPPQGITWNQAHAAAAARGGYLATITSAIENQGLFTLTDRPELWSFDPLHGRWNGPWLGGVRATQKTELTGTWMWTELEAMSFTQWAPSEPRDAVELDRLSFGSPARSPTWVTAPQTALRLGYIVEYSGAMSPRTVGLLHRDPDSFAGYTLLNPLFSTITYLVDPHGRVVKDWPSQYVPGTVAELLPDGNLLRAGVLPNPAFCCGAGGIVEEIDWNGKVVWSYSVSTSTSARRATRQTIRACAARSWSRASRSSDTRRRCWSMDRWPCERCSSTPGSSST